MDRRGLLTAGALLGATALFPGSVWSAPTSGRHRFTWRLAPPGEGGLTPTGLAGMKAAVQKNIDAKMIAGAVTAVARHDKLVWLDAQGWADVQEERPMRTDSLFHMMSSTKVVTAVATLMMMEEGKLALSDPVSRFIPSFRGQKVAVAPVGTKDPAKVQYVPASRDVTIEDLLTHTSGLSTTGAVPAVSEIRASLHRDANSTLASTIPALGSLPLDYQPGTLFRYSPLDAFDTLLYIVQLVSKTPADRFLRERLFHPLEMRNTYFSVPRAKRAKIAQLYEIKNGAFLPQMTLFSGGPTSYFSGAGGLISCAHDMLNFELMLLRGGEFNGRRLLKTATVDLMRRDHAGKLFREWFPPLTGGNDFGLGVRILREEAKGKGRSVGAFGWGGAYGTETWADPGLDLAAVLLIQGQAAASTFAADFTMALRNAIAV